jgi:hypothetical protein
LQIASNTHKKSLKIKTFGKDKMTRKDQLEMLYTIQARLRILQENGLWELLQDAKVQVIKTIKQVESKND